MWEKIFALEPPAKFTLTWVLWYLVGNNKDGPYGTGIGARFGKIDWPAALKWWFRNPVHNLVFNALSFKYTTPIFLLGTPRPYEGSAPFWPIADGILLLVAPAPFFSWRFKGWEGYAGWRPATNPGNVRIGALGLTIRRSKKA